MGNNTTSKTNKDNVFKFEDKPFSSGPFRDCYKANIVSGPNKGESGVHDKLIVVKLIEFVRGFQDAVEQKLETRYEIKIMQPTTVSVASTKLFRNSRDKFKNGEYVTVESFLRGVYEKFNSNGRREGGNSLMNAFSHWTFIKSNQNLVICDLQGVKSNNTIFLTDPAIHSRNQIYGKTDLGFWGLENQVAQHKCSHICSKIGLPQKPDNFNIHFKRKESSFSFQKL